MKSVRLLLVLIFMTGALAGCGGETPTAALDNPSSAENAAAEIPAISQPAPADSDTPAPSAGEGSGLTAEFLTGQKFKLVAVNGVPSHAAIAPTLAFEPGFKISGKICNAFSGPAQLKNGLLIARPLVSTRMACADEGLNQLETFFHTLLENGAEISMDGTALTLKHGDATLRYEADLAE